MIREDLWVFCQACQVLAGAPRCRESLGCYRLAFFLVLQRTKDTITIAEKLTLRIRIGSTCGQGARSSPHKLRHSAPYKCRIQRMTGAAYDRSHLAGELTRGSDRCSFKLRFYTSCESMLRSQKNNYTAERNQANKNTRDSCGVSTRTFESRRVESPSTSGQQNEKTSAQHHTRLQYVSKRKPTMCKCDVYLVPYAPEAAP